jgi:hypothetical protein
MPLATHGARRVGRWGSTGVLETSSEGTISWSVRHLLSALDHDLFLTSNQQIVL